MSTHTCHSLRTPQPAAGQAHVRLDLPGKSGTPCYATEAISAGSKATVRSGLQQASSLSNSPEFRQALVPYPNGILRASGLLYRLLRDTGEAELLPGVRVLGECGQAARIHVTAHVDVHGCVGFGELSWQWDPLGSQGRHWRPRE